MFFDTEHGVMLCFFGAEGPKDVHRIFSAFSDRARLGPFNEDFVFNSSILRTL